MREILSTHPGTLLYTKVNGKYKVIKNDKAIKDNDSIVLISIGRESLDALYNVND